MSRKKKHEEHVNHERWLVSYADFITLLFAFFVTMYASSRVDGTKMGYVLDSIQKAFGAIPLAEIGGGGNNVLPNMDSSFKPSLVSSDQSSSEKSTMAKAAQEIKQNLEKDQEALKGISISSSERGLVISVADKVFFDPGQATIRGDVKPALDSIGKALFKVPNPIRVEGHTDNQPINTPQFPSNWELSTARSTAIIRYLLTKFWFDPRKLSAAGYGEYRPVAPNNTPEGRDKNRRVDIIILNSKYVKAEEPK